jgi:HEAT repeat protein
MALALNREASAVTDERLAVQLLQDESAWDGALAFDRACYHAGISGVLTFPAQTFSHGQKPYVRLLVEGPPSVRACLNGLEPGRRGVTGAAHWFDGFQGGLVTNIPPNEPEDRVPDTEWLAASGQALSPPTEDAALVDELARGSAEALKKLQGVSLGNALVGTRALAGRGGPGALAALELIARQHPHWRVRRAAIESLNPIVSTRALMEAARRDASWEVRAGAVEMLQTMANTVDPSLPTRSTEAAKLVIELIARDAAWEVRRQAIWTLSSELVGDAKGVLRERLQTDPEPRVRATALEALAGARQLDRSEAKRALKDPAPEVRAIAAVAFASEMRVGDAPELWKALNDPARGVRLAASGFLARIQDATIGPKLWELYLAESELIDADPSFQRVVLDELGRAPFPELASKVRERLQQSLAPEERRLLSLLFSKLEPAQAAQQFLPETRSEDARVRALSAEVAPDTPEVLARRLELLQDNDSDVRAAAVLGLCRSKDAARHEGRIAALQFEPTPLGQEAVVARSQCGAPEPRMIPLQTALEAPTGLATPDANAGLWPAVIGLALMFFSVFAIKLIPADSSPPAPPAKEPEGDKPQA